MAKFELREYTVFMYQSFWYMTIHIMWKVESKKSKVRVIVDCRENEHESN